MKLKERIIGAFKFFMGASRQNFFGSIVSPGKIMRRVSAENDPYSNFAGWTYFAIDKIAERVASIRFELYDLKKNGDVDELDDHELLALLYRANPLMTKSHMMYLLTVFYKIWGVAPVYKERIGKNGRIVNLWPMRPDLLKMRQNENGDIVAWEYWVGGRMTEFPKDDILYISRPDPKDPVRGYGNFQAAALEIDSDTAAVVWNKHFFENNAEPGGVLETDQVLEDDTFERLKKTWYARYGGASNAGKVAILEAGLKWKATEQTGKEAGYIETRAFNRDTILTLFGVPKGLFVADDVNLSNAEVAERTFLSQTVDPLMGWFVDSINEFLVPEFGDNLWLSYESPVKEDRKQKLEEAKAGTNAWQTINETRSAYNLPPVEGGDVLYLPFNIAPMGSESEEGKKTVEFRVKTAQSRKQKSIKRLILARTKYKRSLSDSIAEKAIANISVTRTVVKGIRMKDDAEDKTPEDIRAERKIYLKNLKKRENVFKKKLRAYFTSQLEEVRKKLESEGIPKSAKSLKDWIDKILSVVKYEALVKLLKGEYETSIEEGAVSVSVLVGSEMADISATQEVVDFVKTMSVKFAKAVNDTTMDALRGTLSDGVGSGESMSELTDRVAKVFDDARNYRTERIARTEVGRAQNFGRYGEMKALGVEKRMWVAIFSDTRDSHAAVSGRIVNLADPFDVGGHEAMYPQDSSLPADESVNCQCSVSPYMPSL